METEAGPYRILVVDDDADIASLVAETLHYEGFVADSFCSGNDALASPVDIYDLAILDIMMPGMDGFELCRRIRALSRMPIIFLSAKDEEADQILGLTLGADDYVTKPFRPKELVARVRAQLRRASWDADTPNGLLAVRELELDTTNHVSSLLGRRLELTPREFDILGCLMESPGTPHSTREIWEAFWEEPFDDSAANSVMVHIRRLRKKIAEIDDTQEYIVTVWGVGYKMAG